MLTFVITGASTGIGRGAMEDLVARGHRVIGTVRKEADAQRLRALGPQAHAVVAELTRAEDVARLAQEVRAIVGDQGLAGLVNNAGIAVGGPLEYVPVARLREQLEVNVVAPIAVTQALLPLLRRSPRSRVVFVGSVGGIVASPGLGPYAASKHAIEAIADTFRIELRPFGIEVSLLEPGPVDTAIWDKADVDLGQAERDFPPETLRDYQPLFAFVKAQVRSSRRQAVPVSATNDAIRHALTSSRPRTRYLVGSMAKVGARVRRWLPDRAFDRLLARAVQSSALAERKRSAS